VSFSVTGLFGIYVICKSCWQPFKIYAYIKIRFSKKTNKLKEVFHDEFLHIPFAFIIFQYSRWYYISFFSRALFDMDERLLESESVWFISHQVMDAHILCKWQFFIFPQHFDIITFSAFSCFFYAFSLFSILFYAQEKEQKLYLLPKDFS